MRPSRLRAKATPLIAVIALCAALTTMLAGSANAAQGTGPVPKLAPRRLTVRTFERRVLTSIRAGSSDGSLAAAAGPAAGIPEAVAVEGAFHVKSRDVNFPDWFVGAFKAQGETYIAAATGHESETAFEDYEWIKQVPDADVAVGSRLLVFNIHTGTDLGALGRIDMTFTAAHTGVHKVRCPKTKKLLLRARVAQGSFAGTMSFFPGAAGFPAVLHATQPHATLARIAATGATCPQSTHYRCYANRSFVAQSPDGGFLTVQPRSGFGEVDTTSVVDGVSIFSTAVFFTGFGGSGDSPVTLTPTSLTIDGDMIGGLFAGSVVFDRSGPQVIHTGARCKQVYTPFLWHTGSLDVNFASGTFSLTGADLDAQLIWEGPAR